MTPLIELTKLKRVDISYNQISNIPSLIGMEQLTALYLPGNRIRDITSLQELTQLTDLVIQSNPINTENLFSVLTQLTRLRTLGLSGMKISDITLLARLTQLRTLYLGGNQISNITPLTALTNLHNLYLSNNQISDITPIVELVNLRNLGLIGNPIKDREPLIALLRKNPDVEIWLNNDKPLPVTLSHFRAELTEAGILLKWVTQSEVDNAGFYIYRSQTKDGEFKVVTPTIIQGAGTTSERHTYTWTDTTAKPNTVYYYRIGGHLACGVRKQLATVSHERTRLRKWEAYDKVGWFERAGLIFR